MQKTLGRTSGGKRRITWALNSCGVFFATHGMVANRYGLLLGAVLEKAQTRFAFSFVDEASRQSIIPMGLDLASMGGECLFGATLGSCARTATSNYCVLGS